MATTLLDLEELVRIELRDPDGATFQDADIDYAINQAYRKTFQRVVKAIKDHFVTTDIQDIIAATRLYALPADCLRVKSIELIVAGATIPIYQRVRAATMNTTTGGGTLVISTQSYVYDFEGSSLAMEPTPQATVTDGLLITYYATYTKLVDPTDEIHVDFQDIWVDVLVLEAAVACFSQIEALGGTVSVGAMRERLREAREAMDDTLTLRTLSPRVLRKKRYFQ